MQETLTNRDSGSRAGAGAIERLVVWAGAREDALYWWAFAVASIFTIAPLWSGTVLPFQDWAGNMSYAAILEGVSDGNLYDQTYRTGGMLLPNSLLFWTWVGLSKIFGLIIGGKVFLTFYCVGLPAAMDRLLCATGRDRRFALLAFPLVYNYSMMMGFASYATTLPLLIYCVARAFRFQETMSRRDGVIVALIASLTFLGHAQVYLVLGVVSLTFVVMVPRTWAEFRAHCYAFGSSLLVFLPWFYEEFIVPSEETALGGRDLAPVFEHPGQMFAKWGEHTINRWQGVFDDWTFAGMLLIFALGIVGRRVDRQPGEGRSRFTIEAITFVVLLTYIAIPEHTIVQAAIGSRLVVIVMLFGIAWLHMPQAPRLRSAMVVGMTGLAVLFGAQASSAVHRFNEREIGENFLPMIDALPDGSTLAVITAERESQAVTVLAHQHIYGYHFALNQGLTFSGFHSFYGRHAQWRPGKHFPYPGRDPRSFLRGKNACVFDFLLVRTTNIPRWQHLAPRLTYLDHSARYSLWKIDHDRVPACRQPKKKPGKKEPGVAKTGSRTPSTVIANTLEPLVGPTRGRDLDGRWAAPPKGRPQSASDSDGASAPPSTQSGAIFGATPRLKSTDIRTLRAGATAGHRGPPPVGTERRAKSQSAASTPVTRKVVAKPSTKVDDQPKKGRVRSRPVSTPGPRVGR